MVFDITVKAETAACRIMVKRTPKFASEDPFGHISCATNELMQFLFTGKQGHHGSLASKVPSFQSETKTHCQELIKMMNKQQISLKQPFNTVQRQNTPTTQQLVLDKWRLHIVFTQARLGRWGCR